MSRLLVGLLIGFNWGAYHERSAQSSPPTTLVRPRRKVDEANRQALPVMMQRQAVARSRFRRHRRHRDGPKVRLYTRNAYDWTTRLPAITSATERIKAKSFTI